MLTDYEQQALEFLAKTNTTLEVKFKKHGRHFHNDKDTRDIYEITLKRGNRVFTFDFGQSVYNSVQWIPKTIYAKNYINRLGERKKDFKGKTLHEAFENIKDRFSMNNFINRDFEKNENYGEPTAYDVLACLTTYDVGSFEDFCNEFGYDTDSKTAEKIYNAVVNEYNHVCMLWTDEEIEQLQEIQ